MSDSLPLLERDIVGCELCPRLREYCRGVAIEKRRAWRDWEYWGQPVPGFGDPNARLLILGLAPGAHGANRTGRMFTGDRSGDFLYPVLYKTGFASQPASTHRGDGLTLKDARITSSVRCAPPANKPLPEEIRTCQPYLIREVALLPQVQVVVALGRLAFDTWRRIRGLPALTFAHNVVHDTRPILISSYHPSQQNTSTGKLTEAMFLNVFLRARKMLAEVK
jgi:uracil-DNA glycosylase